MTPLDHTKGGSRAGLMEQRSKDLSGVYKNPDILSSKQTDAATDAAITNRLITKNFIRISHKQKRENFLQWVRR